MSEYTPTTETVRERFADGFPRAGYMQALGDFDRWLAAHDAKVRAGVVAEEPEWEYGRRSDVTGYTTEGIYSEEQASNGLMDGWSAVRRRKAGPWEPLEN